MSVILGYDESPGAVAALETAIRVAKKYDEELVVVYASAPPGGVGEEFRSHQEALAEIGREALSHASQKAKQAGITARTEIVPAKPVDALLEQAEIHDASVIVVGTWGESPMRGALLGSTPHKLLHLSTRPVLCVPMSERNVSAGGGGASAV